MRSTKTPLLLALAAVTAGCLDSTVPPDDGPGRLVWFASEVQAGQPPEQPLVTVLATGGRLEVETVFRAPDVCRSFDARLRNTTGPADEAALILEVKINRVGQACGGAIARFGYEAIIEAPPGTYLLQVQHRSTESPIPEPMVLFSSPMIVP